MKRYQKDWYKKYLEEDFTENTFNDEVKQLFITYKFTKDQKRLFHIMKTLKNKQDWWKNMNNEHIVWVIGVKKFDCKDGDMRFYKDRVEAMKNVSILYNLGACEGLAVMLPI